MSYIQNAVCIVKRSLVCSFCYTIGNTWSFKLVLLCWWVVGAGILDLSYKFKSVNYWQKEQKDKNESIVNWSCTFIKVFTTYISVYEDHIFIFKENNL